MLEYQCVDAWVDIYSGDDAWVGYDTRVSIQGWYSWVIGMLG